MTTATLTAVLGEQHWVAQVADEQAAIRQASTRMAAGRPAVSFSTDGKWFVGWGIKGN